MSSCPIPHYLKKRPRYGGLPAPYIGATDADTGKPLFGFNNEVLRREALGKNLCGQCGNPLGKVFVFIGDEFAMRSGVFRENPMHLPCARYSLTVCPYLTKDQHLQTKVPQGERVVVLNYGSDKLPPSDKWGIYMTRSFEIRYAADWCLVFKVGEQVGATIWYAHGKELN